MAASASASSGERVASELSLADKWDSAWENVIRQTATGGILGVAPSFILASVSLSLSLSLSLSISVIFSALDSCY